MRQRHPSELVPGDLVVVNNTGRGPSVRLVASVSGSIESKRVLYLRVDPAGNVILWPVIPYLPSKDVLLLSSHDDGPSSEVTACHTRE